MKINARAKNDTTDKIKKVCLFILKLPGNVVSFPIKLYRKYVSPCKGVKTCRFYPTCSKYALDAVKEWGALVGVVLALWRILRCNPFCRGGYDSAPKNPLKEYFRRKMREKKESSDSPQN